MYDSNLPVTRAHIAALLERLEKPELPDDSNWQYLSKHSQAAPSGIAASRYTDAEHLGREQTSLFRNYPLVLEHASRIPAGHCLAHDALGLPLLISNDDGQIRVFLNQCRHRGTRLVADTEPCPKKHIVCPYHNWTYRLDGALHSLPQAEGFVGLDREQRGLIELPSAVRSGLIFALPSPAAKLDIDAWIGDLAPYLDELETGDYHYFQYSDVEYACNWKLPIDAFLEAYHLHRLHKTTLAPLFADNVALGCRHGWHYSAAVARTEFEQITKLPREQWDIRNHVTFSLYLLPNTVLIYHPDYISLVRFWPVTTERCRIEHSMLIPEPPADDAARGHWQRAFELTDRLSFAAEDFHICEEIQQGLRSGAQEHLLLGSYEQSIARFHETLDQLMSPASASGSGI